jgi:hypothetical protein
MIEEMRASLDRTAAGSEFTVTCRAETADCTCPENCERDHGND